MVSRDSYHLDSRNDGTPARSHGELLQKTSFTTFDVLKASKDFSNALHDSAGASSGEDEFDLLNNKEMKKNDVAPQRPKDSVYIEFE